MILEHDGRLRRIIGKESGLPESGVYSAFQDRADGSLWLGQGASLSRVDVNSPLLVLARNSFSDLVPFNGMLYASNDVGGPPLYRLVPDARTGIPALHPLATTATQIFAFTKFHDSSGGRDQLLEAAGNGILRIDTDTVTPTLAKWSGKPDTLYAILQSRKYPNRVYGAHGVGAASSMRWEGGKWIDEGNLGLGYSGRSLVEDAEGALWVGMRECRSTLLESSLSGLKGARMDVFSEKWTGCLADRLHCVGSADRSLHIPASGPASFDGMVQAANLSPMTGSSSHWLVPEPSQTCGSIRMAMSGPPRPQATPSVAEFFAAAQTAATTWMRGFQSKRSGQRHPGTRDRGG